MLKSFSRVCQSRVRFNSTCHTGINYAVTRNCKIGSTTKVVDVSGDDNTSLRLLEMGLTPGVEVTIVGAAPLGDPVELELRGYRLSIRRNEAARVVIAT